MFNRAQLFIALALSAIVVVAILVFVFRPLREAERVGALKGLFVGVVNYMGDHGSVPPPFLRDSKGRRAHSWRVLLLPYVDHPKLYDQYNEDLPWDAPENRVLLDETPEAYRSPAAGRQPAGVTNYLAVVGHNTTWPPGRSLSTKEWTEFPTDTVMIVEDLQSSVQWTEPRDLGLDEAMDDDGPFRRPGGVLCLFHDGSVRLVGPEVDRDVLASMLTGRASIDK